MRSRTSPPAGISRQWTAAIFVPQRDGFTASASPRTTYAWKASLQNAERLGAPNSRSALVSFSVKISSGTASPTGSTAKRKRPSVGWATSTSVALTAAIQGRRSGGR